MPRTDRKDPYAIRSALLLVLVVAALAAGPDRWGRIASAFTPAANTSTALLRLDAWVTPPVYTGIAPIVLADGSEPVGAGAETFRALSVPERSQLLVRVFSPRGETVSLVTQPDDGTEPKLVTPRSTGSQGLMEFNMALVSPGAADVKVGGNTVAKWRFDLIKDSVAADRPHGQSDHDAARRASPELPRHRRSWRGERRSALRARRDRGHRSAGSGA